MMGRPLHLQPPGSSKSGGGSFLRSSSEDNPFHTNCYRPIYVIQNGNTITTDLISIARFKFSPILWLLEVPKLIIYEGATLTPFIYDYLNDIIERKIFYSGIFILC
jgi:hypothetical protein